MGRRSYGFCCYYKRTLTAPSDRAGTAFTQDHVRAEARGGTRKVPCCLTCNRLKGDLPVTDWFWIVNTFDRYWKRFHTHLAVRQAVIGERARRATAGLPPLSAEPVTVCRH